MSYGIDVSFWQEGLDFKAAKAAGKDFCIVRLGRSTMYGAQELDDLFVHNINAAKAAGMDIGVYFYSTATTQWAARQEAQWLLQQLDTYLNGVELAAGIWYDVEEETQKDLGAAALTSVVMAFINTMTAAGKYVGIYAGYDTLTNCMNVDDIPKYVPFWVSHYNAKNYFAYEHPEKYCPIWQYSDSDYIAGVNVDTNYRYD